jgi:hypothetical protein
MNVSRMNLPNFLLVGAAKAGTTSLHYALDQHPQIFMSAMKEPSFFWAYKRNVQLRGPGAEVLKHRYVEDLEAYQALFAGVPEAMVKGESSVRYLTDPYSPGLIHNFIPQVKLVVILRQPADRAFSSYMHYFRDGMEPCSDFREAIRQEQQGIRDGWTFGRYLDEGMYHLALSRYLHYFDKQQLHISLMEDLINDPDSLMRSLYQFLGVNAAYHADMSHRHNVSGVIRNPWLRWIWTQSNRIRAFIRPLMPERLRHWAFEWVIRDLDRVQFNPGLKVELTEFYRQDILQLQDLIERDLSAWLEPLRS